MPEKARGNAEKCGKSRRICGRFFDGRTGRTAGWDAGSLHLRLCGGAGKLLCLSDVYPVCGGDFCCGQRTGAVRHRLRRGAGRMPAVIVPLPCGIAARSRIGAFSVGISGSGKPAVSGAECRGPAAPGELQARRGRKIREGGPRSDRRKGRTVLPKERRIYAPAARRGLHVPGMPGMCSIQARSFSSADCAPRLADACAAPSRYAGNRKHARCGTGCLLFFGHSYIIMVNGLWRRRG